MVKNLYTLVWLAVMGALSPSLTAQSKPNPMPLPVLFERSEHGVTIITENPQQIGQLLKHKDPAVRQAASCHLFWMQGNARPVVPNLTAAMTDADSEVRYWAALALGGIGPEAGPGHAALAKCLRDQDEKVRTASALSLFKICPIPKETFPALRKALEDKDPYVRIYSAGALGKMRNDDKAFSTLLGALEANDDDLRRTAIQVLGGAGLNAVPTILACTKSTKGLVRNAGASALAFLADEFHRNARPFPQVAIKQLEVLLEDKDPEIVLWAIYVSSKIAHQVYDLLPRLIVCLQHPNDSIRRHAAAAVSKFGMVSIFAVPFLMTQINRETDDNVKEAMLLSLHTIVTEQIREKVAKILWRRVGPHSK